MKISKLFHWLYCAVMFLPLIMFLPNGLYYAFNEHATNTEIANINYKYQSNEVNTADDIVIGNVYHYETLDFNSDIIQETEWSIQLLHYQCDYFDNGTSFYIDEVYLGEYENDNYNYLEISWYQDDSENTTVSLLFTNRETYSFVYFEEGFYATLLNVDFIITQNKNEFINWAQNTQGSLPLQSNYNVIDTVEFIDDTITHKMYLGWQQVWELPVFSWTHNTFFSAPFNYISSLFGFQAGNSISYLLSYWFSISIIWLVFDLMIYVPLLVHRWLDKASLS